MIVCHCNVICTARIKTIVEEALEDVPAKAITPAMVHAQCGKSPNCGRCQLTIHRLIKETLEENGVAQTRQPTVRRPVALPTRLAAQPAT